jgi:hypothetical protein
MNETHIGMRSGEWRVENERSLVHVCINTCIVHMRVNKFMISCIKWCLEMSLIFSHLIFIPNTTLVWKLTCQDKLDLPYAYSVTRSISFNSYRLVKVYGTRKSIYFNRCLSRKKNKTFVFTQIENIHLCVCEYEWTNERMNERMTGSVKGNSEKENKCEMQIKIIKWEWYWYDYGYSGGNGMRK